MFLLLLVSAAHAMCGTYVGPAYETLENELARVIVARNGDEVVLTLASDVLGSTSTFGVLIPVPEVLLEEDVSLAPTTLFDALDGYTAPRIVSYTCDDLLPESDTDTDTDADSDADYDTADGVTVEASYSVGAYDIDVVAADGADGLLTWLDARGFALTDEAAPVIQDYLDAGQYFLAAQVDLEAAPESATFLEPLQLRYTSAAWTLPIRIGTTVSPGVQDAIVYTLADGRIGISNYPEASIEDECLLPESVTDVGAFYDEQLATAFEGGIWFTEYAWRGGSCDPCAAPPIDEELLAQAGAEYPSDVFVTRLHLRFTPGQATADLNLYETYTAQDQVRYIAWNPYLEGEFPTCGGGIPAGALTCDDSYADTGAETGDGAADKGGCGCAAGGGEGGWLAGVGLLLAAARRRPR